MSEGNANESFDTTVRDGSASPNPINTPSLSYNIVCTIDCREHRLAAAATKIGLDFEVRALDYGDVHIQILPASTSLSGCDAVDERRWVFERKTTADLAASINDGRYREQKMRLQAHVAKGCVGYILEGASWSWSPEEGFESARGSLIGAALNTIFRDSMHVVHTHDVQDTAWFIKGFVDRARKDPRKYHAVSSSPVPHSGASYEAANLSTRRVKMSGCTAQLSTVPGVSAALAGEISARFGGSIRSLIYELECASTACERLKLLERIPRVGRKTAGNILVALGFAKDDKNSAQN
jgi:ERCC4-type nuclease